MYSLRVTSLLALSILCTNLGQVIAQTAPPAHRPEQAVEDLGDLSHAVRAEAQQRLLRLGRAAVPALEKGLKHTDCEIRERCQSLLPLACRSPDEADLDSFVNQQRDARRPPLPGWTRLKSIIGDDLEARLFYAEFYRKEKDLLILMETNSPDLVAHLKLRLRQFKHKTQSQIANKELEATNYEFRLLVLIALHGKVDPMQFAEMSGIFYGPVASCATTNHAGTRKMVSQLFAERLKETRNPEEYYYVATKLQLTELIDDHIRPLVKQQINKAMKSKDNLRLMQALFQASQLQSPALIEECVEPMVLKRVEKAESLGDFSSLQQAVHMCQMLSMQETFQNRLKPVVAQYLRKSAADLKLMVRTNLSHVSQVEQLAEAVGLKEMFDALLRPTVIKIVAETIENVKDPNRFQEAFVLSCNLNMREIADVLVKPAARHALFEVLEQPLDWFRLNQAVRLCQQVGLQDLLQESVKPVFIRNAAALLEEAKKEDHSLQNFYWTAFCLNANQVTEDHLKPALRKYFQTAIPDLDETEPDTKPIWDISPYCSYFFTATPRQGNGNDLYQLKLMKLANTLHIKEAVPYALKIALNKHTDPTARGEAVQIVGTFGNRDQVQQLVPLLKDTGEVGQSFFNFINVKAEVRDVVLAVLLTHKGENVTNYGFPYFQQFSGNTAYDTQVAFVGFANSESRAVAFGKYNALLKKPTK